MARTSPTELPSEAELFEILSKESQRLALRYDYMQLNPGLFDAYKQLGAHAQIDMSWVDDFAQLTLSQVKQCADVATDALAAYIHRNPADYGALFDALNVNDTLKPAECIFVFGSQSDARIIKAVELYHQKLAPKLVISGRGSHYGRANEVAEAARMREYAIGNGVPKSAVITERDSITLPDNVKRTIDLFETMNWRPQSIISVSTTFVQRRAQLEWYKYLPWSAHVYAISSSEHDISPRFRRATWSHDDGVRLLLNEYNKIIVEQAVDLWRAGTVQ